jgi:hypothetical protein
VPVGRAVTVKVPVMTPVLAPVVHSVWLLVSIPPILAPMTALSVTSAAGTPVKPHATHQPMHLVKVVLVLV